MFTRLKTFLSDMSRAGTPARNPFEPRRSARN
ncbi:hypothetical protein SAMN04490244_103342 [Tranquillimonas rosea]|uniref:Uncharacterized protein n=1 Tax=Tranquillimonas rosea TaxID=641238 RepID=A0A1H9SR20_9RHOB|nr:hypothetical protein SAMN04490244_103342 [Tranquillimonas rosea]